MPISVPVAGPAGPGHAGQATTMDGALVRDALLAGLRAELSAAGSPQLCMAAVVRYGDPEALRHAGYKRQAGMRAGLRVRTVVLPAGGGQTEVAERVAAVADDPGVHGVLVQLPMEGGIDPWAVMNVLPPAKDVDGLGERSLGRLLQGVPGHVPGTALGVLRLLQHYRVPLHGRHAVVLGGSRMVGLPLAVLLARPDAGARVSVVSPDDPAAPELCRQADILICDSGRPRSVTADLVAPGAAVVDVGPTRTDAGPVGDVDLAGVRTRAGWVAPNPGGAGPVTVASLLANTVQAARWLGVLPLRPPEEEGSLPFLS